MTKKDERTKISVIGCGAMGSAFAEGLLRQDGDNYQIFVSNPSKPPLTKLEDDGAIVCENNAEAASKGDIIVIAVKPWILPSVIAEIKGSLDYSRQKVCVIAASVPCAQIMDWFTNGSGECLPIMLAMPNTAMRTFQSMTFIVPVKPEEVFEAEMIEIFDNLGSVMVIDETHLPAATSLASCGIAYALRYIRSASEGGVQLGFKASVAQKLICQTLIGAVSLLGMENSHPEVEIDKVTTPGGLTIKGLNAMEEAGFTNAVIQGILASAK